MKILLSFCLAATLIACGGADDVGIGGQCEENDDCKTEDLTCLTNFKGGYCGASDCTQDADCPEDSFCVAHTDGTNYCFRTCTEKAECNENRDAENESNCSSSISAVETTGQKACVPPSG